MGIEDVALACSLPGLRRDRAGRRGVGQGGDRRDARVQGAGLPARRASRRAQDLHRRLGPVRRSARPTTSATASDLTIVANGLMVAPALDAAETLAGEGIKARVLDMHTVKPIDRDALEAAAKETGALVVAEEHLAHGGLGSVVAMTVAEIHPVPIRYVNLGDQFGESGAPDALLEKYGLTAAQVAEAARAAVAAKKQ